MKWVGLVVLAACGAPVISHSRPEPLPPHTVIQLDMTPKEAPRLLGQEQYLHAYLAWFGGLGPLDVQYKARPKNLFDTWEEYLAALGMPDYRTDVPRATQSNALMAATISRLGEALCVRAAERDFNPKTRPDKRVVFTFEASAVSSRSEFVQRFDVLHRLFLSYPVSLAPKDRAERFFALYQAVAARGATTLDPNQRAWAAVCTALIQHPEARVY